MSRISLAALAFALTMTSVSLADEPNTYGYYGNPNDPFSAAVPSGLRFGGANLTMHSGGIQDPGGSHGCSSCSEYGCLDWKYNTWYASWDGHHGYGNGHCRSCGNGGGY